jgi:DNA-binding NarL/FixJ family response regulator
VTNPDKPTPRQLEVLGVVIEEAGSRDRAATRLGLSMYTVREHLAQLYAKLGAHSTLEAALLLGWICLPAERPARAYARGRPPKVAR